MSHRKTYGAAKVRTMARSVLPATANRARSARADLAVLRRQARRTNRQQLGQVATDPSWIEEVDHVDFAYYPDAAIRDIMYERRLADNLGALLRWAPQVTSGSPFDRYAQMQALLPDNLQGRHALSHIKYLPEFRAGYDHDGIDHRGYSLSYLADKRRRSAQEARAHEVFRHAVRSMVENGQHKELNAILRQRGCARLVEGLHDAEDFVAWAWRQGDSQMRDAIVTAAR